MNTRFLLGIVLLLASSVAQHNDAADPGGVIYGVAVQQDGQPAKGVGLTAMPLGVALATALPHTKTNDRGEYRFANLPWWGKYTVYAEDEDAGYATFINGPAGDSHPAEVEITAGHREAEFNVHLPPKAAFLRVHLVNRKTGAGISGLRIAVMGLKSPLTPIFTMSCSSTHVILLPPDRDLLLHITSDGFREWNESVGNGKAVHLASGTRTTLDVELDPVD